MIKAIIVDDQESYRRKLRKIIDSNFSGQLEIVGEAASVKEGMETVRKLNPELVFLDIEMQDGSGFDLLEKIGKVNFDVIFVTAHNEFAIRAIKFSALDYLLKPIDETELTKAVQKLEEKKEEMQKKEQLEVLFQHLKNLNSPNNQIGLPTINGLIFVKLNDIVRCQGAKNYTDFFLINKSTITVSRTLKEVESLLREHSFLRIHDSHLINLCYIKKYIKGDGGTASMADGSEIDISRGKKDEFKKRLRELNMIFD